MYPAVEQAPFSMNEKCVQRPRIETDAYAGALRSVLTGLCNAHFFDARRKGRGF